MMSTTTFSIRIALAVATLTLCSGALGDRFDDDRSDAALDAEEARADAQRARLEWGQLRSEHDRVRMEEDGVDEALALKIAALEALMNAPPERAMPLIRRILDSNQDERLKMRALFVLSQTEHEDAPQLLLQAARTGSPSMRQMAIRSIGIGGDSAALKDLVQVYRDGDQSVKRAVLRAFLIADEDERVFELARTATQDDEFEDAVRVLASMGATDRLRQLKDRAPASEGLIRAYAVAGDIDSLTEVARSDVSPEIRQRAIRAIGVTGGDQAGAVLVSLYRETDDSMVRAAVMEGLMVADDDQRLLELFRASTDDREKRRMLRMLVSMDSDAALDIIDNTLRDED